MNDFSLDLDWVFIDRFGLNGMSDLLIILNLSLHLSTYVMSAFSSTVYITFNSNLFIILF